MNSKVRATIRAVLAKTALCGGAVLAAPAFGSPNAVGSCADMRGSIHSCTAYSGSAFASIPGAVAEQKSACRTNPDQTWNNGPCPTGKALAHCLQDASILSGGKGTFFIDTYYYAPLPAGVSLNAFRDACEKGNPKGVWTLLR